MREQWRKETCPSSMGAAFCRGDKSIGAANLRKGLCPFDGRRILRPLLFFEWPVRLAPAVPLVGARRVLEEGLWKIILDIFNGIP